MFMKKIVIKDSNDLLKYLLKHKKENREVYVPEFKKQLNEMQDLDFDKFAKELEEKNILKRTTGDYIYLYMGAEQKYINIFKKILNKISPYFVSFLSFIVGLMAEEIKCLFVFIFEQIISLFQ